MMSRIDAPQRHIQPIRVSPVTLCNDKIKVKKQREKLYNYDSFRCVQNSNKLNTGKGHAMQLITASTTLTSIRNGEVKSS